jgi:outer membrane cobalamin receptor
MRTMTVLAIACSALAAQGALGAEEPEVVQVTAGRIAEPWLKVPQAITVVTPEEIERMTPQVMTDLLRGQPGMFPQS